jgi:hypothetical protein
LFQRIHRRKNSDTHALQGLATIAKTRADSFPIAFFCIEAFYGLFRLCFRLTNPIFASSVYCSRTRLAVFNVNESKCVQLDLNSSYMDTISSNCVIILFMGGVCLEVNV